MAGKMISELSDATTLQSTDLIPLARGATTLKISGSALTSSLSAAGAGSFALKTDLASLSSTSSTTLTGLSSTVDNKFIVKPATASAQQVLTYNGSTATWVASAAPGNGTGGAITATNTAKAWVNFNGTTSPGTIRSSYNVSSVTKNGTGDYTVNFATAMADANYSTIISGNGTSSVNITVGGTRTALTGSCRIDVGSVGTSSGIPTDRDAVSVAIFGN